MTMYTISKAQIDSIIAFAHNGNAKALNSVLQGLLEQGEAEPVAWQIDYKVEGISRTALHSHNAVGDYRMFDTGATSTPLFTHPPAPAIAAAIHYPECWDVMAYPTLESALGEVYAYFKCTDERHPPAPKLSGPLDQHSDDLAVDAFALAMKAKMKKQREKGYGGWELCPTERLQSLLFDHIGKGDPVDVGNFAMMLFNGKEKTALRP